jgi:UDP:flavonoid glycosyltransferase YjiC (YdhE family)
MRVLLSTYGSRGDVEPMVALAAQPRALGGKVQVCAPPDEEFAELLAGAGVRLGRNYPHRRGGDGAARLMLDATYLGSELTA